MEMSGAAAVLATAFLLAVMVERVAEYLMPVFKWAIENVVSSLARKPYTWEGPAKLFGVSLFNAGFYIALVGYDFVSPILEATSQATVQPWQGLTISTILVAGGSNLIHQVFTERKEPEPRVVVYSPESMSMHEE